MLFIIEAHGVYYHTIPPLIVQRESSCTTLHCPFMLHSIQHNNIDDTIIRYGVHSATAVVG